MLLPTAARVRDCPRPECSWGWAPWGERISLLRFMHLAFGSRSSKAGISSAQPWSSSIPTHASPQSLAAPGQAAPPAQLKALPHLADIQNSPETGDFWNQTHTHTAKSGLTPGLPPVLVQKAGAVSSSAFISCFLRRGCFSVGCSCWGHETHLRVMHGQWELWQLWPNRPHLPWSPGSQGPGDSGLGRPRSDAVAPRSRWAFWQIRSLLLQMGTSNFHSMGNFNIFHSL